MYNSNDKYVAYVGTYTHGSSIGIHVYDLDVENGYMTERNVVPVKQRFPYRQIQQRQISLFHRR